MGFIKIKKICVIIFCSFYSYSQPTEWMNKLYLNERKINNIIPNTITQTKTIVFYSTSEVKKEEELKDLHEKFLKTNIDVVNYIFFQDYLINNNIKKAFVDYFIQREIKHIIFYNQQSEKEEEILISFFNNKTTLISTNKNIWYKKGQGVFGDLEKTMLKNNFQEGNFLPNPQPETIEKIKIKTRKAIIGKTPNLTKEKLGVVLFQTLKEEKTKDLEVLSFKKKTEAKNKKLKDFFLEYKNDHNFIEEKEDSRFYFTKGVKYMLKIIFARKELIEQYLKITIEEGSPGDLGYFVFLEHSFSKNIFLRKNEKMYLKWEDAVQEFITNNQKSKL